MGDRQLTRSATLSPDPFDLEARVLEAPRRQLEEPLRLSRIWETADRQDARVVIIDSPRRLVVGIGTAALLTIRGGPERSSSVETATSFLRSIRDEDRHRSPRARPIALGALPFDPAADGTLVVPEVTVVAEPGTDPTVTLVGDTNVAIPAIERARDIANRVLAPPARAGNPPAASPTTPVSLEPGDTDYLAAVTTALDEVRARAVHKVVVTRRAVATFDRPIDVGATLDRLRIREPSSTVFAVSDAANAFVGASPELLVSRDGRTVRSVPLAGTLRKTGSDSVDEAAMATMITSAKENREHRAVVDAVVDVLSRHCEPFHVPRCPDVMWLRQIAHLATHLTGSLAGDPAWWPTALALACELHPTPAVGGTPRQAALDLVTKLEPAGRGLFAGPVGWVDASGDGTFVIGIRSAHVSQDTAVVYAGAGIVSGSDPYDELDETTFKLDTILGALTTG